MFVPCPVKVSFKIFSVRADIYVENSRVNVLACVFFGQHRLFDRVSTADRGTVSSEALIS